MKKYTWIVLVLALLLLSACSQDKIPEDTVLPTEAAVDTFPEELRHYRIPWELDAVTLAKESKSMHYFFMSGQGMEVDIEEENPSKWGDSCLVVFPDGQTMLIDSGVEAYGQILVENLRRLGLEKLDYILFSHSHHDHCFGALAEGGVLDSFPVGKIYWTGVRNTGWEDRYNIENTCQSRGIPLQILQRDDILTFGEVSMEALWPMENAEYMSDLRIKNHNNQSMVVRFDYQEHSSLFPGDMYARGELDLVTMSYDKLDVDLLKAAHHGQTTSNTEEFINAVSPELTVATGYLPIADKIQKRYAAVEATLLHDLSHGYIHVWSDGSQLQFETSQNPQ